MTEKSPQFTRYLYSLDDVKQSLLISLLEKKCDEALFWAYEFYFSGFQNETFVYLANIFDDIYRPYNENLSKFLQDLWDKWIDNNDSHHHIGTFVSTLIPANYCVSNFAETYMGLKCTPIEKKTPSKFKMIIRFKPENVKQYETVPPMKKPRLYLSTVCKFPVRKECANIFNLICDTLRQDWKMHWLYYSANTPIWTERIVMKGGAIDEDAKDIVFPDDDTLDDFYDEWGLEPDEQSIELMHKIIGNGNEVQLSMKEFCEKYGGKVITKKLSIRKPKLKNSITYM
jgi:hypothetical protein